MIAVECNDCGAFERDEHDGTGLLVPLLGWREVEELEEPFDWATHSGLCPVCVRRTRRWWEGCRSE